MRVILDSLRRLAAHQSASPIFKEYLSNFMLIAFMSLGALPHFKIQFLPAHTPSGRSTLVILAGYGKTTKGFRGLILRRSPPGSTTPRWQRKLLDWDLTK